MRETDVSVSAHFAAHKPDWNGTPYHTLDFMLWEQFG